MCIGSISRKTEQKHSFWPEVKQNYNFSPTTLNGSPQCYSMLTVVVDWQQFSGSRAEAGALRLSVSLPLLPAWWGRVVQPGGGKSSGAQLWQSAQPTLVKFAFCLQKVKLTKTFQVRSLETCQFDFSQWKNGIFVHKINLKKKKNQFCNKGMFYQKILLTECSQLASLTICIIKGAQNIHSLLV